MPQEPQSGMLHPDIDRHGGESTAAPAAGRGSAEQFDFTEDCDYFDCYLGTLKGREAIREYIKPLMASFPEVYSTYEWDLCSPDGRCVVHMQNRRDNPEPGGPSIDCAGITVL